MIIKCSKCKRQYHDCAVRKCPHEAVQARYGEHICRSCCLQCGNAIKSKTWIECKMLNEERVANGGKVASGSGVRRNLRS